MSHLRKFFLLSFAALMLGISSCESIDASKGPKLKKTVDLKSFDGITLDCGVKLRYIESPETRVEVSTTKEVLDKMRFEVIDGKLEIGFRDNYIITNTKAIEIFIQAPSISEILIIGSGRIVAEFDILNHKNNLSLKVKGSGDIKANNLNVKDLNLKIAGSGDIDCKDFTAENINSLITGSGDIALQGTCHDAEVQISGSGSYSSFNCEAYKAKVNISGSGDCDLSIIKELDISIVGSGDVSYKGNPMIKSQISGSGKVQHK